MLLINSVQHTPSKVCEMCISCVYTVDERSCNSTRALVQTNVDLGSEKSKNEEIQRERYSEALRYKYRAKNPV